MKSILFSVVLLCGASVAHAQLLPVPGTKNPDWILEKSEVPQHDGQPTASSPSDRMPNAAQKSITSIGNRHSYWNAKRQLAYGWESRPGEMRPEKLVTVREGRTGIAYTYRRRSQ